MRIALLLALQLAAAPHGGASQPATPVQAPEQPTPHGPSLAPLVQRVKGTVVSVTVREHAEAPHLPFHFGGDEEGGGGPLRRGLGSGVIIDPSGLVLTNNHVVEGAEDILVKLDDGRQFPAKVLGRDPQTDLALVQAQGVKDLPVASMGDSDTLSVGDYVVAIGNPFGLSLTVTLGIVSAKERVIGTSAYDDFIQTDAAINPGNSGGPLFDLEGKVVGINAAIVAGGQGIGFAVPINMVRALLPQLRTGKVTRGFMGVVIQDLSPELAGGLGLKASKGALVSQVQPNSPAGKAGIQVGEVIVSFDGEPIESGSQLSRKIAITPPGRKVTLGVLRNDQKREVTLALGEQPRQGREEEEAPAKAKAPKAPSKVGITLQDLSPQDASELGLPSAHTVLIVRVDPGSPSDDAGLRPGDALLQINRTPVTSARQAAALLKQAKGGTRILMRVQRGSAAQFLVLEVPR